MTNLWTVGHSTRTLPELLALLHENGIELLADVRSMPGSNRLPHFNKENLAEFLPDAGVAYAHLPALGGRRRGSVTGDTAGWKNKSFRSYADYTFTDEFRAGLDALLLAARDRRTAFMCSEAVPWRCHRSIISTILTARGHVVHHIMAPGKVEDDRLGAWGATPCFGPGGRVVWPDVQAMLVSAV